MGKPVRNRRSNVARQNFQRSLVPAARTVETLKGPSPMTVPLTSDRGEAIPPSRSNGAERLRAANWRSAGFSFPGRFPRRTRARVKEDPSRAASCRFPGEIGMFSIERPLHPPDSSAVSRTQLRTLFTTSAPPAAPPPGARLLPAIRFP